MMSNASDHDMLRKKNIMGKNTFEAGKWETGSGEEEPLRLTMILRFNYPNRSRGFSFRHRETRRLIPCLGIAYERPHRPRMSGRTQGVRIIEVELTSFSQNLVCRI